MIEQLSFGGQFSLVSSQSTLYESGYIELNWEIV